MSDEAGIDENLNNFISENWEKFSEFEEFTEKELNRITRDMPPELFLNIQMSLFKAMLPKGSFRSPTIKLVIDSNIVIQDAIRVAKGRTSSTERILSSAYIEVVAPENIVEETERNLRKKFKDKNLQDIALKHARKIISKISKISEASTEAINKAQSLISSHSPEDVPFLALAIEHEVDGIMSRDIRAFDQQSEIERWELGETAELVIIYESGSLYFVVTGLVFEGLIKLFESFILMFVMAFEYIVKILSTLIVGFIEGSIEMLVKIPWWVWMIIIVAGITGLVILLINEDIRQKVTDGISKIGVIIKSMIESIILTAKNIWKAIKDILIWIWDSIEPIVPYTVVFMGVIFKRISKFITDSINGVEKDWDRYSFFNFNVDDFG